MPSDRPSGVRRIVGFAARVAVVAVFLVPLLWILSASLRQPGLPPPRTIEWIPDPVSFEAWIRLFTLLPFGRYLGNSLLVVAVAVPLSMVVASAAGFAMTQLAGPTRRALVVVSVILLLIPVTALWLTRFLLFRAVGLDDSLVALMAPAIMGGSPLFVLLYFWAFRRIPAELIESARLEGGGAFSAWWRIGLPLTLPTSVVVAALAFLLFWGDFVSPTLYLRSDELYTLTIGLRQLQQLDRSDWSLLMAGAVLLALPAVALFAIAQRTFLRDDRLAETIGG